MVYLCGVYTGGCIAVHDIGLGLYEAGAEPLGRMIIIQDIISLQKNMADFAAFPPGSLDLVRKYLTCHFL